ncbi:MAG TPA: ArsR family transcriptional regulator [Candidatus Dormibacteraeota bacterium]|nr:ArsR family transcriptional regulator [Candidatus Dormibacteraeota bacterium]
MPMMNLGAASGEQSQVMKLLSHDLRWRVIEELALTDRRVQELGERANQAQNLVSYHLGLLRRAGLVRERRSSADARDVYYSLDLEELRFALERSVQAVHPSLQLVEQQVATGVSDADRVWRALFLCTHNSARSQMAEAILRQQASGTVDVASAGSDPREVHPLVFRTLTELGVDCTGLHSKHVSVLTDQSFDYVITLCDIVREVCPEFPGDPDHLHWSLPDPIAVGRSPRAAAAAFRQTADELMTRTHYLLPALIKHSDVQP